jgi:hypothetical protein
MYLRHSFYNLKGMKSFEPFSIVFLHNSTEYKIGVMPVSKMCDDIPDSFEIAIEDVLKGIIQFVDNKWISYDFEDEVLVELLGKCIREIYEKKDEILEMNPENSFSLN